MVTKLAVAFFMNYAKWMSYDDTPHYERETFLKIVSTPFSSQSLADYLVETRHESS